jgi:microcystin-dependent protein
MNFFKKKIIINPLHKGDDKARRSFIRKSIAAVFGATILTRAEDIYSMESKTGYIYVKQNGEVINDYQPMGDSQPFLGQINIFGFNYAPVGWTKCNGQILSVTGNIALYALLGNTYGGSGNVFALPDFRGRVPLHAGQGPGLSNYSLGDMNGYENVTLLSTELPSHTHQIAVNSNIGTTSTPANTFIAKNAEGIGAYGNLQNAAILNSGSVTITGSGNSHNNLQPVLSLNFCIATQGIFPIRP